MWELQLYRNVLYQGAFEVVRRAIPPPFVGSDSPALLHKRYLDQPIINARFAVPSPLTPHGWQPVSYEPFIRSWQAAQQQATAAAPYPHIQLPTTIVRQPKLAAVESPSPNLGGGSQLDLAGTSLGAPRVGGRVVGGVTLATTST